MVFSTLTVGIFTLLQASISSRFRQNAGFLLVALLVMESHLAAQPHAERPRIPPVSIAAKPPMTGPDRPADQLALSQLWLSEDASALAPTSDAATAIACDSVGNVYVSGWSARAAGGRDMLLIKYDPHGNRLWQVYWNSAENLDDYPLLVAIDRKGNCLLSGFSSEHDGGERMQTLKFSGDGKLLWQQTVSANAAQRPVAMQIDDDGNYLLAINSITLQSGADIGLLCYSPAGRELWSRNYSSSGYRMDVATGMIQGDKHIYLSGYSEFNRRGTDFLLLCYSRTGELIWQRLHDAGEQLDNQAVALARLPQGGVLLAGTAQLAESASAYAVVAYSNSGERLFQALYRPSSLEQPRLTALMVDSEGRFTLAGFAFCGTRTAIWLLGCDRVGVTLWQKELYDPGSDSFIPVALQGDRQGGVLLSAYSDGGLRSAFQTASYSADGDLQWSRSYAPGKGINDAVALTSDANGQIYITGYAQSDTTGWDIATVSYLADGRDNWQSVYASPASSSNTLVEVVVGAQESLFSLGSSMGSNHRRDAVITCHNPLGGRQWQQRLSAGDGGEILQPGLIKHPRGGVLFFAIVRKPGSADELLLMYLLRDGRQGWRQRQGIGHPVISAIVGCIGSDGELFLALAVGKSGAVTTALLLCRELSGELRWKNLPQSSYRDWLPVSIAAKDHYIAIAGSASNGVGERDYLTLLCTGSGDLLWANSYAGAAGRADEVIGMQFVPGSSDLVVTGNSYENGFNRDITTICYSAEGALVWQQHYDGNGHNNETAIRLVASADGSLLIGASAYGNTGGQELLLLSYSSDGSLQWESRYGSGASGWYQLRDLHATSRGIYIAGSYPTGEGLAQLLLKLDYSGRLQWQHSSLAEPGVSLLPVRIRGTNAGDIFVAGNRTRGDWSVMQLAGYRENTAVSGLAAATPAAIVHNVYPNPFNPQTTISFTLQQAQQVDLAIYTILGREVTRLAAGRYAAGQYQFTWDAAGYASGLYLYRLQIGARQTSGRLLLVR